MVLICLLNHLDMALGSGSAVRVRIMVVVMKDMGVLQVKRCTHAEHLCSQTWNAVHIASGCYAFVTV